MVKEGGVNTLKTPVEGLWMRARTGRLERAPHAAEAKSEVHSKAREVFTAGWWQGCRARSIDEL